jgi:hypothetical protein
MAKRFLPGALSLAIAVLSLNFVPPVDAKGRDTAGVRENTHD